MRHKKGNSNNYSNDNYNNNSNNNGNNNNDENDNNHSDDDDNDFIYFYFFYSPMEMDITLTRSSTESLGFSLVGGVNSSRGNSPVYVRSIAKGGIAAQDGRLHQGDEIIKINGIDLTHRSQDDVVKIIKITPGNLVLTVIPREVML